MTTAQPEDRHSDCEKQGYVRIRKDRIKRVPLVRVQVGGLFGKKKNGDPGEHETE